VRTGPYGYGVPEPVAHVHRCGRDDHPLHRMVGMRDPNRWYVMTVRGCVGDVTGYDSESEARVAADSWLAANGGRTTGHPIGQ
jgi:hypothetical protein